MVVHLSGQWLMSIDQSRRNHWYVYGTRARIRIHPMKHLQLSLSLRVLSHRWWFQDLQATLQRLVPRFQSHCAELHSLIGRRNCLRSKSYQVSASQTARGLQNLQSCTLQPNARHFRKKPRSKALDWTFRHPCIWNWNECLAHLWWNPGSLRAVEPLWQTLRCLAGLL